MTGRKSLYLSSHAGAIVGWPMPEARGYLRDLIEHATQREFVYTHKWRVGDLVMWDNRQTMHRARPFPAHEPRDMRRTTLAGDGPTAAQHRRLMQIGFNLPNSGPLSKVADMTRLAVEGEAMGFDYLTVTDHVVLPDTKVPGYPYSEAARSTRRRRSSGTSSSWAWPGLPPRPRASGWSPRCWSCRIVRRCWRPRCWRRSTC